MGYVIIAARRRESFFVSSSSRMWEGARLKNESDSFINIPTMLAACQRHVGLLISDLPLLLLLLGDAMFEAYLLGDLSRVKRRNLCLALAVWNLLACLRIATVICFTFTNLHSRMTTTAL